MILSELVKRGAIFFVHDCSSRHEAGDHDEILIIRTPGHIMDRSLGTEDLFQGRFFLGVEA